MRKTVSGFGDTAPSMGERMSKKIAVVGTGANGGGTAAALTHAGLDVVLIDQWPAHVEAMRANGLQVNFPDETINVPVEAYHLCEVCTLNQMFDVVLVMVKAYDTRWACELIKPYLKEDGLLVGVQNAMMLDDIEEIVGPERTLGCVMEMSSEIFTPGIVQRNTTRDHTWFGIGSVNDATAGREGEIAELLRHVGNVDVSDEIISAKWMKLVVNTMCLGPLAMLGLTLYEAMKVPGMREFTLRAGTEALAVEDLNPNAEANIFAAEVFSKVMELPEAQRSVVELVYVQGFKYSEAARILDIPIGTVMSRLSAARATLAPLKSEDGPIADERRD